MTQIKLIVDGGSMKPGPTVAQQLGPMGINLGKVIEDTNQATAGFKGMKVPIIIDIDKNTKKYVISVSSPPVSELIKKELKIDKASGKSGIVYIGNLSIEQAISIAITKMPNMLAKDLKSAVKLVIGSCVSLGTFVESKTPLKIIQEINDGKYDKEINSKSISTDPSKKLELDNFFSNIKSKQEEKAKEEAAVKEAEDAVKKEEKPAPAKEASTEKKPDAKKVLKKK